MQINPRDEKTIARSKVMDLLDPGSFMELGEHIAARYTEFYKADSATESDGVVTGYGTIDGNLVFIYAQDADVMGGTFGEQHGLKIVHLYEQAIKSKAPVIGLIGCQGFRIEEGLDGLHQFANLYGIKSYAAGFIPQIDVVIGQCGGGMSISAEMADFTFVEKDKGSIFVNPQSVVENAIGDNPHISAFDDGTYEWEDIKSRVRWLIDNLPGCSEFVPEIDAIADEDLNRNCDGIAAKLGDGKAMLAEISDDGYIMEMCPDFGQDMVTGLMKLCGQTVGAICCSAVDGEKRITSEGCMKAAYMVDFCDNFGIPVITITDTEGYQTTSENEKYLPRAAAKLLTALADAEVPKINIIAGSVVGSAYSLLNAKGLSADYVFMWDTADVSIVNLRQATEVVFGEYTKENEQAYRESQSSAMALARHGFADKVIAPEDTRKYLIGALQTFINSR